MPWRKVTPMSQRKEFILLALQEGANIRSLCRRYGISPKTGHKWLKRYKTQGATGLADQPRTPTHFPNQTPQPIEEAVLAIRDKHPAWGGRKIHARLLAQGQTSVPVPSTIQSILHRHHRIDPTESEKHKPWHRFEHEAPNRLWQMDFKGHFPVDQRRCYPLTVLDDHSRFALCLKACVNQQGETVQTALTHIFLRYGLPDRMTMDNGAPWGDSGDQPYTWLTLWLIRLGIRVSHSRPYHPQTQGKDERFHRTLKLEVLSNRVFHDFDEVQHCFDEWRDVYNLERPHEALSMRPPASRYQPSPRPFPDLLPPIEYGSQDIVRKVQANGEIHYQGRTFSICKAFQGYPVALRPTQQDGLFHLYFCQQKIKELDLKTYSN
ncbi:MAG TPA: IS481 family transposase [Candidatus Manganitrophaceae bacterium]|nr:IS481 family transposase [Candidatus Manganitrophaceae bacterium]